MHRHLITYPIRKSSQNASPMFKGHEKAIGRNFRHYENLQALFSKRIGDNYPFEEVAEDWNLNSSLKTVLRRMQAILSRRVEYKNNSAHDLLRGLGYLQIEIKRLIDMGKSQRALGVECAD